MATSDSVRRRLIETRFDIVEELADDGVEAVFVARHKELGDECLVKVMRHVGEGDERHADRLPWLTRLSHPRLAQLYDLRFEPSGWVIVEAEYVPGTALDALLAEAVSRDEEAPLPLAPVYEILDQCLEAVEFLHGREWFHGALSPAKFRLARDAGANSVRLVDPGVGRLLGGGERTTAGGLLARRLRYSAPERFLGEADEPTAAVDVYAIGLVAYELFTGRYPISGDSATALAAGHLLHPPLSFEESDPRGRLSEELRSLLLETLAKEPERRPPSVDDLRRRLRAAADVSAREAASEAAMPEADVLSLLLDDSRVAAPGDRELTATLRSTPQPAPGSGVESVRPSGPSVETFDMREARDEAKRREGKEKVRRLVREAGEAVTRSDYTAALDLLREGLRFAPEEPKLVDLLRQVESAARRQKAEAQRRRKIDDEVRAVEALLQAGEEAAARDRLLDIEERLGTDPRLAALLRTLEPEEAEPDAKRQADDLVSEARRLSRSDDFSGAREALRRAVELDPEHSEARTLSESVEALVELGAQEGKRRQDVAEADAEIRGLLERGDPGGAMAKLNRAVARYGDLPELQKLRYDVARVFLEEDAVFEGEGTHITPMPPSSPPPSPASSPAPRPSAGASPSSPPPPAPSSPQRARESHRVKDSGEGTVFDVVLSGHGSDEPPPSVAPPERRVSPWLDLRDPRGLVLLLILLALVAYLGHWAATRDQDADDAPDPEPAIEVEDVEGPGI